MLKDTNGNVRVKLGNLEDKPMPKYMFHFTRDGKYVDGVLVSLGESGNQTFLQQLAETYCGCHAWVYLPSGKGEWVQMVAVALPFAAWQPEANTNVPECVRTAELMRGV